jgi:hypothetical protein
LCKILNLMKVKLRIRLINISLLKIKEGCI